jgi:uncharacterized protein
MISEQKKLIILEKLKPYKPKRVSIFGSYARGKNNDASDLDILVDLGVRVNLLEFIGIEQDLSETFGVKVDLVTEQYLHPLVRPYVEKDIQPFMVNKE